jgi:Flp pilus assembly protein TadG
MMGGGTMPLRKAERVEIGARRPRRGELGASVVEMALASTILFAFIVGIMSMSLAIYSYHYISEAAREGTRYAIVRGSSAGAACSSYTSGACTASSANIQTYVKSLGFPGINGNNMTVNPSWSAYPTGVTCTPSASCNNPGNLVTVNIVYTFPIHVPFVRASAFTLNSTAAMVISQ